VGYATIIIAIAISALISIVFINILIKLPSDSKATMRLVFALGIIAIIGGTIAVVTGIG
jgi:hypothetical protein